MNIRTTLTSLAILANLVPAAPAAEPSGAHDFDFFRGHWQVQNRKRLKILQNVDEWETFEATVQCSPLPGGVGNTDHYSAPKWRPGYVGVTIRVFNPATNLWSIFWLNNKGAGVTKAGQLDTPVVGRFENGVGIFECDDTFEGKPIRCRYRWHDISHDQARWEQSFSPDGGKTWEVNWEMHSTRVADPRLQTFELRQYQMQPGRRDVLIEQFEREFLSSQEATGIRVLGQFRQPARPDQFVWLRAFTDLEARPAALGAFYRGAVWKAHAKAANETMIDATNVLLLRPLAEANGYPRSEFLRPPFARAERKEVRVVVSIAHCRQPVDDAYAARVAGPLQAAVSGEGSPKPFGWLRTEPAENNFPALAVRKGENVIVWLQRYESAAAAEKAGAQDKAIESVLGSVLAKPLERLVLEPTEFSRLW